MKAPSKLSLLMQKLGEYWTNIKCRHYQIVTTFNAEVFIKDGWERCSGRGMCKNCGLTFTISVPKNDEEMQNKHYLGKFYNNQ